MIIKLFKNFRLRTLLVFFLFSIIVSTVNFAVYYGALPKFSDFLLGHLFTFYIIFPLNFSSYFKFSQFFGMVSFFLFLPLFIFLHYLYFYKSYVWPIFFIFMIYVMISLNWLINATKLTGQ